MKYYWINMKIVRVQQKKVYLVNFNIMLMIVLKPKNFTIFVTRHTANYVFQPIHTNYDSS